MKKILITGNQGFIGKNLMMRLNEMKTYELYTYDRLDSLEKLVYALDEVDFVFHLAGINRPLTEEEFFEGNQNLTEFIVDYLLQTKRNIPILLTSSIQATTDHAYGKSKKGAEEAILEYVHRTGANSYIYRLPNVFGKWCRPHYNSAVATFCHQIANDQDVTITDEAKELTLVYIDDVINCFVETLENSSQTFEWLNVTPTYRKTLGEMVALIKKFKNSEHDLYLPNMQDDFTKKLYSTYLSYLVGQQFKKPLKMNVDTRGSFTELLKHPSLGQISINISKPGVEKGNHYHHTKVEKFIVVSGEGVIKLRKMDESTIYEVFVTGEALEVVDIPPGYTHLIKNIGTTDLVTVIWANESFDSTKPDTHYKEV